MTDEMEPGDGAWALGMVLAGLALVACVVAPPVYVLAGRQAGMVTVFVGAGLAVLSVPLFLVAMQKWGI